MAGFGVPIYGRFWVQIEGCKFPVVADQVSIYFEYAYLRDLWYERVKDNQVARDLILELLDPPNRDELSGMSVLDFNTYFGAVPRASSEYIQSPGNWRIQRYRETITDDSFFWKTCRFKWGFNAKPDIVIHTSNDTAVCVEAEVCIG